MCSELSHLSFIVSGAGGVFIGMLIEEINKNKKKEKSIIATAWNNGSHHSTGAGYGIQISIRDRDKVFDKNWKNVLLELQGQTREVKVNINKKSFWGVSCRELISKEIGAWLKDNKKAPWPKAKPPKLTMEHLSENKFEVGFE